MITIYWWHSCPCRKDAPKHKCYSESFLPSLLIVKAVDMCSLANKDRIWWRFLQLQQCLRASLKRTFSWALWSSSPVTIPSGNELQMKLGLSQQTSSQQLAHYCCKIIHLFNIQTSWRAIIRHNSHLKSIWELSGTREDLPLPQCHSKFFYNLCLFST